MDSIERRALYNLLRMNWLTDPTMAVEPWQVEDYRSLPLPVLFERLEKFSIHLDRTSFMGYADESDSPEELTDILVAEMHLKADAEDQIYLLIFELWRRLLSEKPSLSIFCNELDHQIHLYDQQSLSDPTDLTDAISNFIMILEENTDQGIPPKEAFELISTYCANDLESFLYDFISEQIDTDNDIYVQDLLDDFSPYLADNKWFDLLRIRHLAHSNLKSAHKLVSELIENHLHENDLEFNIELLSFLVESADSLIFTTILKNSLPLIQTEEDFQDLVQISADYFHRLDQEKQEKTLLDILKRRSHLSLEQPFDGAKEDLAVLHKMFAISAQKTEQKL